MAYKVFTNGSPLPASDLNTYLMDQSVMVFANSSARTTALPTPTEGMVTYLEDTNLLYVWTGAAWTQVASPSPVTTQGDLIVGNSSGQESRLAIGTNGQILQSNGTTATWATPAGNVSNWDQLATGALSGAATITLSGFASKEIYYLRIANASMGASGMVTVRINGQSTNYENTFIELTVYPTYDKNGLLGFQTDTSAIRIGSMSNNGGSQVSGGVFIYGGKSTADKVYHSSGTGNPASGDYPIAFIGNGNMVSSSTITTFEIRSSNGNFDNGNYFLYGSD